MTQTTEIRPGAVSIRDEEGGDGRTLEGTALVYGEPSRARRRSTARASSSRGARSGRRSRSPRAVPFFNRHGGRHDRGRHVRGHATRR